MAWILRLGTKPVPLYMPLPTGLDAAQDARPDQVARAALAGVGLGLAPTPRSTVPHHAGPQRATSMTMLRLGLVQRPSTERRPPRRSPPRRRWPMPAMRYRSKSVSCHHISRICGGNGALSLRRDERAGQSLPRRAERKAARDSSAAMAGRTRGATEPRPASSDFSPTNDEVFGRRHRSANERVGVAGQICAQLDAAAQRD